jgi:hypothetical protein
MEQGGEVDAWRERRRDAIAVANAERRQPARDRTRLSVELRIADRATARLDRGPVGVRARAEGEPALQGNYRKPRRGERDDDPAGCRLGRRRRLLGHPL